MDDKRRFRPESLSVLESRALLASLGTPSTVFVGGHNRGAAILPARQTVVDQINTTFDRFTTDYLQAQSAYFASGTSANRNSMVAFTKQRVSLLTQELIHVMTRLPGSLSQLQAGHFGPSTVTLQAFLSRRINGSTSSSLQSILTSNNSDAIPKAIPLNNASATLYTLTATNAIEAARASTLNGAQFLYSGNFKKH